MRGFNLVLILTTLAGCWIPNPPDGAFACNPTGKACPDGYSCLEGTCWKNGHGPDLSVTGADTDLGGTDDMGPAKKVLGEKCDAADTCASGFCVDGVCCDTACMGQCQACDTQALGTCSTVTGPPHPPRNSCAGAGSLCGGTCDGTAPSTCTYPSAQTICGAACDGRCNGAGSCSTGTGSSCPNGFACGTDMCLTSCSTDVDCQTNFKCNAPNCVRVPESDCLDGLDNNGDGLADCADPTCTAEVTCAPAVATGNEIGLFLAGACPSTDYSTTEHVHQNLQVPTTCSGCNCSPHVACSIALYGDNSSQTCTSASFLGSYDPAGAACVAVPTTNPSSIKQVPSTTSLGCTVVEGTRDPVSWGTSSNFCAASRTSATCGTNQICVGKPTSGTDCVRVPSAGAACPAGYTASQTGTWYGDSDFQDNRTCACQCSQSGGGCSYMLFNSAASCPVVGHETGAFGGQACVYNNVNALNSWTTFGAVGAYAGSDPRTNPSCSVSSNATTAGTTATPTGGSTICCQ